MAKRNKAISPTDVVRTASADPIVERTERLLLRRPIRYGAWAAIAGVILQMAGFLWDALLHSHDPSLSQRESIFTLTNLSHLLIVLGLACTSVGAVWSLFWFAVTRRGSTRRLGPAVVATVILVALSGTVTGVAISTGGLGGGGGGGGHIENGAGGHAAMGAHSDSAKQQLTDPKAQAAYTELEAMVRTTGTESAITRLAQLAAADEQVLAHAHVVVHELGGFSYRFYGSAATAFSHCRSDFESGCYHGVMSAYFEDNPKVTGQQIVTLCDTTLAPGATLSVRFQCLHGLGHGVTLFHKYNLTKALGTCDALGTDWDRKSCYGGVFMENIVFARNPSLSQGKAASPTPFLKKSDPLYPCTDLQDKYLDQCYLMQTSAILWFNKYDFAQAFRQCDRAQAAYVSVCYQSLGRDIAGYALHDRKRSLELCSLGPGRHRSFCDVGVTKNMINLDAKTTSAIAYCKAVPLASKRACSFAIGEAVASLYNDLTKRAAECAPIQQPLRLYCRRGAQLEQT